MIGVGLTVLSKLEFFSACTCLQHVYLFNWKANLIKLDRSMFENDFNVIFVKLHQALSIYANWPKLCQHTHFKLLQAKIMSLSSLLKLVVS